MTPARGWTMRRVALGAALLASALSLAACHTAPATKAQPSAPGQTGALTATPESATPFRIDSQRSQVLVLVYRDGPMGHLGHNHVIAVRSLTGSVVMTSDPEQSTFWIDFPVEAMSVDEPQLRAALGPDFQTIVDEAAIAGTREHMLGTAVLNSKQYPQIHLQSQQIRVAAGALQATTSIQIRDTTAQAQIPVMLQVSGDDLMVSGEFDLTHSQLGLTPYSVALGALRVAERLHVRYQLVAHRQPQL
jgi:polyisoprenoid-binding protein YceI